MMSKIQILKAIHNVLHNTYLKHITVYDVKDTNFESNSQRYGHFSYSQVTVYDVKDTNFESNSQQFYFFVAEFTNCL